MTNHQNIQAIGHENEGGNRRILLNKILRTKNSGTAQAHLSSKRVYETLSKRYQLEAETILIRRDF